MLDALDTLDFTLHRAVRRLPHGRLKRRSVALLAPRLPLSLVCGTRQKWIARLASGNRRVCRPRTIARDRLGRVFPRRGGGLRGGRRGEVRSWPGPSV